MLPVIETCEGCSGCCRERRIPPFSGPDDPEFLSLPESLQEPIRPLLVSKDEAASDEATCLWLDMQTQRCRHYDLRPTPCREFERGSFYCLQFRRKWNVPNPG